MRNKVSENLKHIFIVSMFIISVTLIFPNNAYARGFHENHGTHHIRLPDHNDVGKTKMIQEIPRVGGKGQLMYTIFGTICIGVGCIIFIKGFKKDNSASEKDGGDSS